MFCVVLDILEGFWQSLFMTVFFTSWRFYRLSGRIFYLLQSFLSNCEKKYLERPSFFLDLFVIKCVTPQRICFVPNFHQRAFRWRQLSSRHFYWWQLFAVNSNLIGSVLNRQLIKKWNAICCLLGQRIAC